MENTLFRKSYLLIYAVVFLVLFLFLIIQARKPTPPGQFCGGFANVPCPEGYTCKLDGKHPDAGGKCVRPVFTAGQTPVTDCKTGGCSGELCLDSTSEDIASICIWKDEFACLKHSVCKKQSTGKCAWTKTPEYLSCIGELNP